MRLLLRVLVNGGAIWIASRIVPGFVFAVTPINFLLAGIVFGLINSLVKPIIELLSFPFILITFGLFHIIINIVLFLLAASLVPGLAIHGFWAMAGGIVIVIIANHTLTSLFRKKIYPR